jgi:hypothetical protein
LLHEQSPKAKEETFALFQGIFNEEAAMSSMKTTRCTVRSERVAQSRLIKRGGFLATVYVDCT